MSNKLYRSSILHFPSETNSPDADYVFHQDGLLVTRNGVITDVGPFSELKDNYPQQHIMDYRGKLLVPGLIDSHVHLPQTEMIASYGEQLLAWLESYTFPTEAKFHNPEYARHIANTFISELFSNGTTTAMVYASVHKISAEALFEVAAEKNAKLIVGKVCMDRNCPAELQDTAASSQKESAELIEKWHGHKRLSYAITPRFAPTSSAAQLAALGELVQQYPDVYIQTHLSENKREIEWVKQLFPQFNHYLDVYDHFNMVHSKSVFGHCLHLDQHEWSMLKDKNATIAFCPSSNLFLGSGLFDMNKALHNNVKLSLATDIGGGTSFNMLRTMGEAYKVCQLNHTKLSPMQGFYMMTQGSAAALELTDSIGNLNVGTDADFVLLDPKFNSLSELRTEGCYSDGLINDPIDVIFALSILADERTTYATYVAGTNVYKRQV